MNKIEEGQIYRSTLYGDEIRLIVSHVKDNCVFAYAVDCLDRGFGKINTYVLETFFNYYELVEV